MKKILVIIIFMLLLIGQTPTAKAITDWNYFYKDVIGDIIARAAMRATMNTINDMVTDLILKGDKTLNALGRPAFISNWRSYLGEGSFRGETVFRYQLGQASTCGYFRETLGAIFGASTKAGAKILPIDTKSAIARLHPYELTARCTLTTGTGGKRTSKPDDKENQDNLVKDLWYYSDDAWGSFLELSRSQNNFYGAFNMAMREFEAQVGLGKEVNTKEAVDSFTPIKAVDEKSSFFDPESPGCTKDDEGRCVAVGDTVTPAGMTAGVSLKLINSEFDFITNADDIEDLLTSVITGLIGKLSNFKAGDSISKGSVTGDNFNFMQGFTRSQKCMGWCNEGVYESTVASCIETMGIILSEQLDAIESNTTPTEPSEPNATIDTTLPVILADNHTTTTTEETLKKVCKGTTAEIRYSKCQQICVGFLTGDSGSDDTLNGRCGVSYPKPECTCAAIDPSVTYSYANMITDAQRSIVSSGESIGLSGDDLGPFGLGSLSGGLNKDSAKLYMNALVAAINAGGGVTATYHFKGDEPILGISNGTETEYYDIITSNGHVWNDQGKVICSPSSPNI